MAALYDECTRKVEVRAPIVGLPAAGKSTLLEQAKTIFPSDVRAMPLSTIRPTIGMNMGKLTVGGATLVAWDVGGQMESLWPSYFDGAHALIFVVDASDTGSFPRVAAALARVLAHRSVADRSVLVVANKQDLPDALPASAVRRRLVLPAAEMAVAGAPPIKSSAGATPLAAGTDEASLSPAAAAIAERVRVVEASGLAGEGVGDAVRWLVAAGLDTARASA